MELTDNTGLQEDSNEESRVQTTKNGNQNNRDSDSNLGYQLNSSRLQHNDDQ